MDSFWKENLAWSLHDAWQLYGGVKIALLIFTFFLTVGIMRLRRKAGASRKFAEDAPWGLVASLVAGVLMFFSHLFVFTPEHIFNEQRATIRSLETNILELQAGKHLLKRNQTNSQQVLPAAVDQSGCSLWSATIMRF
jgi:hypothetical protein